METFFNLMKAIHKTLQSTAYIMLNNTHSFSQPLATSKVVLLFSTFCYRKIREEKEIRDIQIRRQKIVVFTNIILNIKNAN